MSTIGDVFSGIRQVLLMQSEIDRLRSDVTGVGEDLKLLARGLHALDNRIARVEGYLGRAADTGRSPPALPSD